MKEYFLTQFSVILTYIRLFILPINQNLDYDYPDFHRFFSVENVFQFFPVAWHFSRRCFSV